MKLLIKNLLKALLCVIKSEMYDEEILSTFLNSYGNLFD